MPVLPLAAFPVDVAPVDEKPLSTPPAQRGPADVDSAGAAVLAFNHTGSRVPVTM